ncbi:MAG TPA: hypothetical protein EYG73_12875 [Arcobacter sp.]|nr:hypothetical protein [Arcobacter sp.]
MKAKQFILSGFFIVILFLIVYMSIFFYQLGAPLKSEYWIQHSYQYKDYKAKSLDSKKIIIISGSNSLFGINSKTIQEKIGYPVINLAVHAGLDIDFLYYKLQQNISQGDIVVMPLEFGQYSRSEKFSKWFYNGMMTWGIDYLKSLSYKDFLKFILNSEPSRILEGSIKQFESNSTNSKVLSEKEVIDSLNKLWEGDGVKWRGYSYKSLNKLGDINADKSVVYNENLNYLSGSIQVSKHFLNIYNKINSLVKDNNGTLFLTYPVTIKNTKFDLSKKESQKRIKNLELSLNKHNIDIYCNAALFNLERVYFFNTHYHPNKYGALIRSENLAECLNDVINGKNTKLSYDEAIIKVKKLEDKYIDLVKKSNFYIRLKDLKEIKKALKLYYAKNGDYPKSKGFDGFYTKWGQSGELWITGLVPLYLKSLPRDPRKSENKGEQYLYKSNGKDYKLIAHAPEDCKKVKKTNPNLIDKRDCWAYGFWTEGAKNW